MTSESDTFKDFLRKAQQLCSKQEKSKWEISQKLKSWDASENEVADILEILENENFINEERYANAYANDKLKFNHWGRVKIEYELKTKQLHHKYIDNSLSQLNEKEYQNILDNELIKKYKELQPKESNKYQINNKLARFAINKGFESELVFNRIKVLFYSD